MISQPANVPIVEITLPDERYHSVTLTFKVPSRENWLASANRLLKRERPARRVSLVYERLLKTNTLSSGVSKKILESLPLASLEAVYLALWQAQDERQTTLTTQSDTPKFSTPTAMAELGENEQLTLFLLAEDLQEFIPDSLLRDDIQLLEQREAAAMHSYYYRETLTQAQMITLLASQRYRTDFLEGLTHPTPYALILAYLACRRFTGILPWAFLLSSLSESEKTKFPRLARLQSVQKLLKTGSATTAMQRVTPMQLQKQAQWMDKILKSAEVTEIAAHHALPRPIRAIVLVEGETEKRLLPIFAQAMGHDFNRLGIELLPAGGKNQVKALYQDYADHVAVPICIVLDDDAASVADELQPLLRPGDKVFRFSEGEFEDTYDLNLILQIINRYYQPFPAVTHQKLKELAETSKAKGRVQALKAVWQTYNLGTFDKIEFADYYAESLQELHESKPPKTIRRLMETLLMLRAQAPDPNVSRNRPSTSHPQPG